MASYAAIVTRTHKMLIDIIPKGAGTVPVIKCLESPSLHKFQVKQGFILLHGSSWSLIPDVHCESPRGRYGIGCPQMIFSWAAKLQRADGPALASQGSHLRPRSVQGTIQIYPESRLVARALGAWLRGRSGLALDGARGRCGSLLARLLPHPFSLSRGLHSAPPHLLLHPLPVPPPLLSMTTACPPPQAARGMEKEKERQEWAAVPTPGPPTSHPQHSTRTHHTPHTLPTSTANLGPSQLGLPP